ncbi:glycerophosphoryl diester phosphodiesterase [Agromyces flavus]|uniref:Glycerophosphoryl diester phosphodiesterase n=1 Tax=Agromyces flavus TaxID=589382 RepID=A0A1H1RJ55_9MICO|nr:glycerophosphodiester phosphodiesterase family protein [Agromyces flavus]MCP2368821.1 glycerophosphoryl diester phosphodiesterase [Agromyces flavus]GGI48277.1 glycerophosphoryl diester phosphodiesterase [Agromyces flavus]SDS35556.1 glycerophosphoryl diester phosphodiesterase [Agromyces flavus]
MTSHWFEPPRPRVLAHRGLAIDVPENTLAAFERAVRAGATYLETDVHVSADGAAVLAHDPTLKRVASRPEQVSRLTVDELRRVDLGGGHAFGTLDELLHAFPEARLNIDVKTDAAVPAVIEAIRRADAADRVLLTSFSDARRRRLVAALPRAATSAGQATVLRARAASVTRNAALMRRATAGLGALQIPERLGRIAVLSPALLAAAHAAGVEVHVWTVNDEADMRRLLALGVDGLVTDRADVALRIISEN